MKKNIISVILGIFISAGFYTVLAQHCGGNVTSDMPAKSISTKSSDGDAIKVKGSCDMCKKRIESAAILVPGVQNAEWDKKTQILKVTYKGESKLADVQKAVLKTGHDLEIAQAADEAYNSLPGCCKYRVAKK